MKAYTQGYMASRWWCWDMNHCGLALGSVPLTTTYTVYFNKQILISCGLSYHSIDAFVFYCFISANFGA